MSDTDISITDILCQGIFLATDGGIDGKGVKQALGPLLLLRIIRSGIITFRSRLSVGYRRDTLRSFLENPSLDPSQNIEIRAGIIQGVVLDEVGNPLSGAKGHAGLEGVALAEAIRYVESDQNGFFLIDRLEFGIYYVAALEEEGGPRWIPLGILR